MIKKRSAVALAPAVKRPLVNNRGSAYIIAMPRPHTRAPTVREGVRIAGFFVLFLMGITASCSPSHKAATEESTGDFHRIISFAPSITETLFALSLGDRVVGVSSFCKYPPEVKKIPSVGGLIDPNFEKVLRLAPDLVILLKEHEKLIDFLKKNRIEYLTVDNHDCRAILESFRSIGEKCGHGRQADSLVRYVQKEFADGAAQTADAPTALLCVERDRRG
jgi:ABC-type hemin transport system substrate-binding protein